ncbi:MAG: hypothetical protein H6684_07230 [Deltaproteobacteria bacterium]|nr:hypothetical protein [Deltaproteobacteria bacterium]MCB9488505.1 hypothetical protein [Deltaproteobacteria bacterium]
MRWLGIGVLATLLLIAGCSDEFGNRLSGFDTDELTDEGAVELNGRALLQDQDNHSYIRVKLADLSISMLTNSDGEYQLPTELSEGEWKLEASYPYYHSASLNFETDEGRPTKPLSDMVLEPSVHFSVSTNKSTIALGESMTVTLTVSNPSTHEVTLSSTTTPMEAFALWKDGKVAYGGLYPGDTDIPMELELLPGDTRYIEFDWTLDDPSLPSGEYRLFAALTSNVTHPEYFDTSPELTDFNWSLYRKLESVTITVR